MKDSLQNLLFLLIVLRPPERVRSRLVLAARGPEPLRATVAECEARGAEAIAVATDVRDEAAVRELAQAAALRFGRIDVWVNDAGVISYGRFEQLPSELFRAVIETNLIGQVNGSRAALAQFRRQGEGTLINMASVWGRVTTPEVSGYVTSKFAIRAFSECLRQELADSPGITVATILPQAVDTPIFAKAANYSGRRPRPIFPLLDPREVAHGIVRCAETPAREVTYRRAGRFVEIFHALLPRLYERTVPPAFAAGNYASDAAQDAPGNLLASTGSHDIDGGWHAHQRRELLKALLATIQGGVRGLFGRGG